MPFCEQCGSEVSADARFCASCGRPVVVRGGDPSPSADGKDVAVGSSSPSSFRREFVAPSWLRSDWPTAAVAGLILLGTCLAVGLVYGAVAGVAATNQAGGLFSGVLTGAYLPFAMFGVETSAIRYAGDATVGFYFKTLPLPLAGVTVLGVYLALRFAWPRLDRAPSNLLAFVLKMAVIVAVVATMLAALLSVGDPRPRLSPGGDAAFAADVSVGAAAIYPLLIVSVVGIAFLVWRRVRLLDGRIQSVIDTDVGRSVALGVLAFLGIAAVLAVVVLIADIAVAGSGREKAATLVSFFASGLNRGVAATTFAMGGAVERVAAHTSLFDWGSYQRPGPETAPLPLFAWLGLAPAAVAYVTLRSLDREGPDNEQGIARIAAGAVVGFVVTSSILVIVTGQHRLAAGSPRAGFGLALLWAVLAAGAAGVLWARSHGVHSPSVEPEEGDADPWLRDRRRQPTQIINAPEPSPTLVDPDS